MKELFSVKCNSRIYKKRGILFVLILALTFSLLTGCSESNTSYGLNPNKPVTIYLWHAFGEKRTAALDTMIEKFNQTEGADRGIIVEAKHFEDDADLYDHYSDDSEVDMAGLSAASDMLYDKKIEFADINELIAPNAKAGIFEEYITAGSIGKDKKWILFPIVKDTWVLAVNSRDFSAFAKETSHSESEMLFWESIPNVGRDYYTYSNGKSLMGVEDVADYMQMGSLQMGQPIISVEAGEPVIRTDGDTIRKLWDNYYDPYVSGYYRSVKSTRIVDVQNEKIISATIRSSDTEKLGDRVATSTNAMMDKSYEILPYPQFKGYDGICPVDNTGVAIVAKKEVRRFASIVFLEWLTSVDQNLEFACLAGGIPVHKDLANNMNYNIFHEDNKSLMTDMEDETMRVSLQMVEDYKITVSPICSKYKSSMDYMGEKLQGESETTRKAVAELMQIDQKRRKLLDKYITDEHFGTWFSEFRDGLK